MNDRLILYRKSRRLLRQAVNDLELAVGGLHTAGDEAKREPLTMDPNIDGSARWVAYSEAYIAKAFIACNAASEILVGMKPPAAV